MFPFLQSPGTSPDCHDFSSITDSGLAATSANSLRTLGRVSSGPIDSCMLSFLTWSHTWSSLTLGRTLVPQALSCGASTQEVWETDCQWRLRQKICWAPQPSPSPLLPVSQCCSSETARSLWPSFSGWHTCRSASYSLHPSPSSAPAAPCPSWCYPCTLPRTPIPASTACAFPSCPAVWPAGLDSAMPVSCLPCLISYSWGSRALVLYGKHP